jgi:hypothetical protein
MFDGPGRTDFPDEPAPRIVAQFVRFLESSRKPPIGPGTAPCTSNQMILGVDAHDLDVAHRAALVAVTTGHAAPLGHVAGQLTLQPVEPPWRCTFFTPCVARWPLKLCRTITPGGAATLGDAGHVDGLDAIEHGDVERVADLDDSPSRSNSRTNRLRLATGLGRRFGTALESRFERLLSSFAT